MPYLSERLPEIKGTTPILGVCEGASIEKQLGEQHGAMIYLLPSPTSYVCNTFSFSVEVLRITIAGVLEISVGCFSAGEVVGA